MEDELIHPDVAASILGITRATLSGFCNNHRPKYMIDALKPAEYVYSEEVGDAIPYFFKSDVEKLNNWRSHPLPWRKTNPFRLRSEDEEK